MNLTVALTGALPAVVIVSAVLTALVSVFLLWLYRRAVLRAMSAQAGVSPVPVRTSSKPSGVVSAAPLSLVLTDLAVPANAATPEDASFRRALQSLNQSTAIYALGGLVYALVLTAAWMIAATDGFVLTRFLWLFSCYSWPIVLAVSLVNPLLRKRIAVAYCAFVLSIAGIALFRNPGLTFGELLYFWLFVNGPGTLLLFAFLNRRVRAVGPLVLAFMIAAVTGAVIIVNVVGSSEGLMRGIVDLGDTLHLGALAIFILLHVIGFGLFGLLGWPLLRWIGKRYQDKRMSDQSVTLDAIWLFFGVAQSFTLVFEGWGWIFTGIAAFFACKFVTRTGFAWLARRQPMSDAGRKLLLLRVFSLGVRSQKLFDSLSTIWLRSGSISLISGPDLVTTTVEPHEFLDFVGGRLSRRFVQGQRDLEQRISQIDSKPDPDGRHRVNEFFCRADTWQMTMERLARGSDAVLMDLRSFSKGNQGCIFELRQLIDHIPLNRVALVIDDSTDRALLEGTIRALHEQIDPASPNAKPKDRLLLQLLQVKEKGYQEVKNLLAFLYRIGHQLPQSPSNACNQL